MATLNVIGVKVLHREAFLNVTKRIQKPLEEILTSAIARNRQRIKEMDSSLLGSAKKVRRKPNIINDELANEAGNIQSYSGGSAFLYMRT